VSEPVTQAPGKFIFFAPVEMVLEIQIEGIEVIRQGSGRGWTAGGLRDDQMRPIIITFAASCRHPVRRYAPSAPRLFSPRTLLVPPVCRFYLRCRSHPAGSACFVAGLRVQPEAAPPDPPGIRRLIAIGYHPGSAVGIHAIPPGNKRWAPGCRRNARW